MSDISEREWHKWSLIVEGDYNELTNNVRLMTYSRKGLYLHKEDSLVIAEKLNGKLIPKSKIQELIIKYDALVGSMDCGAVAQDLEDLMGDSDAAS